MAIIKKIMGFITIHRSPKDGDKGEPGRDGTNYLVMGWWDAAIRYQLSDAGIPIVKVEDDSDDGFSVYKLTATASTIGAKPPNNEWEKVQSAEFIYMQQAYIERLQAALVTAEKINALDITSRRLLAVNSAGTKIAGINESDNGAYVQYYASGRVRMILNSGALRYYSDDSANTYRGTVRLGDDSKIWFENCALQHQAPTGPFFASDVFVRGTFGSRETSAIVVYGNYAFAFPEGLTGAGKQVPLGQKSTSGGVTYYELPLYSPVNPNTGGLIEGLAGVSFDLVIIRTTRTYRYELEKITGKRVIVVNAHDQNSNIYIYSNGQEVQLHGGDMAEFVNIDGFMLPAPASNVVGRGWLFGGKNDNQWT